ncbi:MAG: hypothetical protein Q9219_004959 [cf. Caloplaca sp. 3 TL-2023]
MESYYPRAQKTVPEVDGDYAGLAHRYEFLPERWLPGQYLSEEKLGTARKAFNPFSIGPRACVGRFLAITGVNITLARVTWTVDFRRSEGELGMIGEGVSGRDNGRDRVREYQLKSHLTSWSSGPMIRLRKRRH